MRRILFGDFGAVARAGVEDVLRGEDVEARQCPNEELLARLDDRRPDVVVLDLDRPATPQLAERLVRTFPGLTVVACSTRRPRMRVYPPFHEGESYESELDLGDLATAVRA